MPYGAECHSAGYWMYDSTEPVDEHRFAAVPTPSVTSGSSAGGVFATLGDIYAARAALKPHVWDYLDGGAGETLDDSRSAFARWQFRPRILTGMGEPSTATTFLGAELALPLLTSSFGSDALFDPEGDRAVARENACHGIASIVPKASSFSLEKVCSGTNCEPA